MAKSKSLCHYHTSSHVLAHQNDQAKPLPTIHFLIPIAFSVFPYCHNVTNPRSVECPHVNCIYSSCSQTPSAWKQIILLSNTATSHSCSLLISILSFPNIHHLHTVLLPETFKKYPNLTTWQSLLRILSASSGTWATPAYSSPS